MTNQAATAVVSSEAFIQSLADSGLFSTEELRKALAPVQTANPHQEAHSLARQLVEAGKLTSFQAEAILHQRFNELRIGNYDVLAKLGAGGMGSVYKARHRKMKRIVALKLLSPAIARETSFVQRFQREVETIAQFNHPNIVMAFDADECEAGHFLIMEFVNGRDLASEVQQNGPLSVVDAVDCIEQSAQGLAYAHDKGIIHRDIKPANLLRDVTSGQVKVADLGLARLAVSAAQNSGGDDEASSLTQAGGILGTIDYMPPEQAIDSTTIDHRADIYSLGCAFYFLLAGKPPFHAGSLMGLLLQHRDAPIPSIRVQRPDVPEAVDAIIRRMLAKKPEDRYARMSEVIEALQSVKAIVQGLTSRPATQASSASPSSVVNSATIALGSGGEQIGEPTPSEVRRISHLVVVLVEPSRTQASIVRKYLQELGIQTIHSTGSGAQACSLAREHQANVLLCALHLADMTGVQLAQMLRAEDRIETTCGIILTSSEADLSEHIQALEAMQVVLLPKPFDLQKLAQALALATGRTSEEISSFS